jgi:muramoyltetrapeptide carboxypeptidase
MSTLNRRHLIQSLALGTAGASLPPVARSNAASAAAPGLLLPPRLKEGDTIGLVSPCGATYESERFDVATETLQALGFKVREGQYARARRGHLAGTDAQRAQDLNAMFVDPKIHGILAMTGGSGATRILHLLDYAAIGRNPKFFGGFSDITVLLNAIQRQTGLVTFLAPMGVSEWNSFSTGYFRSVLMQAQVVTFSNPVEHDGLLAQTQGRVQTLHAGKARGTLLGGNLSVLTTLLGTPYRPDFSGAILCLEDINEYIYRVDRMLAHLKQAGVMDALAGVVLGQFTDCKPGEGYGTLTLEEVFDDYFKPLNIPVFSGAMFGHVRLKFTLPIGLPVEIDADQGSITQLLAAVR